MRDAARIVHEVLTEHANGPDPDLAAAARAELTYRSSLQAMIDALDRTIAEIAAVAGVPTWVFTEGRASPVITCGASPPRDAHGDPGPITEPTDG